MPLLTTLMIAGAGSLVGSQAVGYRNRWRELGKTTVEDSHKLPHGELLVQEELEDETLGEAEDANLHLYLGLSVASLGLAVVNPLISLPLGLAVSAGIAYTSIPIFAHAYEGLKEKRLRATLIDSTAIATLVLGHFYITGALACTLYFGGRKLMLMSEDRSRHKLIDIFGQQPRTVWVQRDREIEIPFEQLKIDDIVIVDAGQVIPIDGEITKGAASVDQHMLTGESQPVERTVGDMVLAATVVLSGRIYINVRETGSTTIAAKIGQILEQTVDYRTTTEARSERILDQGVMPILGLSGVALASGGPTAATAMLNSYFSDGLRLSSPLSMLNFLNIASKQGILVKDGRVLELLATVDTVVFDKTGTLTLEEPHVSRIRTFNGLDENEFLRDTAAVEAKQSHPIARAIVKSAKARGLSLPDIDDAAYKIGYGIEATVGGRHIQIGSARFMEMKGVELPPELDTFQAREAARTVSLVYVAFNDQLAGILELQPTVRPETQEVINALHARGLELAIISGDHTEPTQALARAVGIDRFFAEVLPQDKAALVESLEKEGRCVCFVGDGINDAIALKQATVSVSLSGATTAATDTAQVVLMNGSLEHLPHLFEIGERFKRNMRGNLVAAFGPALTSMGGIFFFGTGVPLAIIMYNVSVAGSLVNAMLPNVQQSQSVEKTPREKRNKRPSFVQHF